MHPARFLFIVSHPLLRAKNAIGRLFGARTVGVQALVTRHDGREVLLVRQTYMPGWSLPGGGVKARETPLAAVQREVREETGIVALSPPRLAGAYLHRWRGLDDYVLLYRLDDFRHDEAQSWEIAEWGWFAVDALPHDTRQGCRNRIAEIFLGAPQADRW